MILYKIEGDVTFMKKKRLALLGTGYLSSIVADAYKDGYLPEYELVGVLGRRFEKTKAFAERFNCKACETIEELLDLKADFTVEAASYEAMKDYAEPILKGGSNLVVITTGVFADSDFYEKIKEVALESDRRVYMASGAVGGFDVLGTAALMGPVKTSFTSKKAPRSLYRTAVFREELMELDEPERVYSAKVKEAIKSFPNFFNVAVAASLASNGPENMQLNIDATPDFSGDDYKIRVEGDIVDLDLNIYSSNYSISGWSAVYVLKNALSPIVF